MGLVSDCILFETVSMSLDYVINQQSPNTRVHRLLDDFIIIGPMPLEKTKSASQVLTFLGIELHCVNAIAKLPEEKYRGAINSFLDQSKITIKELQSLAGLLNFLAMSFGLVVPFFGVLLI